MPKFRKKPVVIEAVRVPSDPNDLVNHGLVWGLFARHGFGGFRVADDKGYDIETLEGTMHAAPGDWIIRGVQGEFYSCKPDIFAATYELVEESDELAAPLNTAFVASFVASFGDVFADLGFPTDEAVELRGDELAAVLDIAPPALTREPAEAPGAGRCATCVWWGDGDDRRVDSHGIEIAPCQHPRSPVDEYPDGAFGCVLHEER